MVDDGSGGTTAGGEQEHDDRAAHISKRAACSTRCPNLTILQPFLRACIRTTP